MTEAKIIKVSFGNKYINLNCKDAWCEEMTLMIRKELDAELLKRMGDYDKQYKNTETSYSS